MVWYVWEVVMLNGVVLYVWKANMLNGVVCLESLYVEWCGMYGKLLC